MGELTVVAPGSFGQTNVLDVDGEFFMKFGFFMK